MDKIIKVHFESDKYYCYGIQGLVQWDKCQKLEISGLDISDEIVEVHFSLDEVQGNAERMYGTVKDGVIHADIPTFVLEGPEYICSGSEVYNAYAWVYVSDEESAETIRKMEFEIKARPKPNGYASPDKQDPFLQEIRKVMNETKDIAQSVRDDADNGVFNGEQGPKGDAGSVHFLVVSELPEENIDESAIYLVPITLKGENNEYAEYIYVEGHWEYIGSATVEVDLSEYVKKDDYAGIDKAGVVKIARSGNYGLYMANNSDTIAISMANDKDIDGKSSIFKPITPKNLDYAVKKALSDCKLSGDDVWTDEEKAKARELLGTLKKYGALGQSALYAFNEKGNQMYVYFSDKVLANAMAQRYTDGRLRVGTPVEDADATTKKYVDDLVGSVESILTELHTHAESLIGGEA